jgi:hypothetical protein
LAVKSLGACISAFGATVKAKLMSPAITGSPEDQLRAPLETLMTELSELGGFVPGLISLIGETKLEAAKTRPDYAVTVQKVLVGFIEIKAPGKGADPRHFSDSHDREQWAKLKSLPNILYTDGNSFGLWRDGKLHAPIIHLSGKVETAGAHLKAPGALLPLIIDFLSWQPIPPKSAKSLAEISARLCRLLRDEVMEQLQLGSPGFKNLAVDWRNLLFPDAGDEQFADGYAQAVTFGLLVARARSISLAAGIDTAAQELRKTNSLIGGALRILIDDPGNQEALKTSLRTLTRVLNVVDWPTLTKGDPDAWLYFYEEFLAVYDNALRKRTGSYYTPPEVVGAMVALVDEALRGPLFRRETGFASTDVVVADPGVGTGTFLLGILRRIASTIRSEQGPGAVPSAIASAVKRLIGFEVQFGPFAVAQLRMTAECEELMRLPNHATPKPPELRLYLTDTLGNPFAEEQHLPQMMQPVGKSRRDANEIKRTQPITVVIGNPPYKEKAEGRGGWIESGTPGREAPLDRWRPPPEWGVSAHSKHLKNLYVYFWRWATWKVFGTGLKASTGAAEHDEEGIVCFITVAGFIAGPGFQRMRDDLRRTCSDIWVIDCSPEGHQPDVPTRIFQGVQQPVCIVLAARKLGKSHDEPARVWFHALPEGKREDKFEALAQLSLVASDWRPCPIDWRAPFLPAATDEWESFPALSELFAYNGSGVMPGRTWIIAPDAESLRNRWQQLIQQSDPDKRETLFHPHLRKGKLGDKYAGKSIAHGLGHEERLEPVSKDSKPAIEPIRYGFRSFDRQWIIPDARLINQPNPTLWNSYSSEQIFLTALQRVSPVSGPAVTLTELIPDLDHYKGSFGGRVFPLWNHGSTQPNIKPGLLEKLAELFGTAVSPEDAFAYIAAALAHPAFTSRFAKNLIRPGLRVPLTSDAAIFAEAVATGREVIWLHTYGERCIDPAANRPKHRPRLPQECAPYIPADGGIPGAPDPLPDDMHYDAGKRRLYIGTGYVENISPETWDYEVSGKKVIWHWFSYRRRDRSRPIIGDKRPPSPLDFVQPESWLAEYTTDLLDLLHVLGRLILLEPRQADLLARICDGPKLSAKDLGI